MKLIWLPYRILDTVLGLILSRKFLLLPVFEERTGETRLIKTSEDGIVAGSSSASTARVLMRRHNPGIR